jgi:hypothetical protein
MTEKQPIRFIKQDGPIGFLITLFSILDKEAHDKDLIIDGNKISVLKKDPSEITKLNVDVNGLKSKVLNWFDDRNSMVLNLTEDESETFRKCVHAAHYFATEEKNKNSTPPQFLQFYNHLKKLDAL